MCTTVITAGVPFTNHQICHRRRRPQRGCSRSPSHVTLFHHHAVTVIRRRVDEEEEKRNLRNTFWLFISIKNKMLFFKLIFYELKRF
ncbi:hypothetical protein MtrunA17_Chr1g0179491 [Medicago truncatula]|uniref:Uncharacterized protein n=1 Tax=Medicago truncatula TaxID=3880 RepID=A0A396JTT4_MEDTR|nr:hypothetical protein MtrunA17_Chr1g0179491 [Medicago truncatula]